MEPDIAHAVMLRRERWRRLVEMDGRIRFTLLVDFPGRTEPDRPLPHPDRIPDRIDWAWRDYLRQCANASRIADDALPALNPYTGTDIFPAAFGCPVRRPSDDMPYARPLIRDARQVSRLRVPDISDEPLASLFVIADGLRRRAGPDALMRLPDIQSPMGIAALIWEKSAFYTALVDAPEAVRELADKVARLLTAFLDGWFRRYGTEFVAHYPDYYLARGITLSEDEIGSVSPEMFRAFFLPHLTALSERYGGIGIHSCAWAKQHWTAMRDIPNLRMLNLFPRAGDEEAVYGAFARVAPQMHSACDVDRIVNGDPGLPSDAHVVLQARATDAGDAARVADDIAGKVAARAGR